MLSYNTNLSIWANQLNAGRRRYLSSSKSICVTELWPPSRVSYTFLGDDAGGKKSIMSQQERKTVSTLYFELQSSRRFWAQTH